MMNRRKLIASGASVLAVSMAQRAVALSSKAASQLPDSPLDSYDAIGLAELVRKRKVSPTELLDDAIERAELINPKLNFMSQRHYDFARSAIAKGLPEGPFTGVPWLLKDLHTNIAGELTENGSRFYRGSRAKVNSELVVRQQRAGFVIFGKTTAPEFGLTPTTENKITGDTRNPWNPNYIAGGSSGGAAVAVAAGVLPAAHATDGGGSIRIPASCCGLFGMKPSRGRIPMGPLRTEGWGGMSVHHAVTRTVRDSAAIMDATHGLELGSRYTAPSPGGTFLSQVNAYPGRLRIALMLDPIAGSPVDPEAIDAARAAASLCESLGHYVEEAAPKLDASALAEASFVLSSSSIAADLLDRAKETGLVPGPETLETITLAFFSYGQKTSGMDFARANNNLQAATVTVAQFMTKYDIIVSPTLAAPPLEIGKLGLSTDLDFMTWGQRVGGFTPFAQLANMTGQPAMSLPLAMSDMGLPMGVMFSGRYGEEALLFSLAGQIERAAPWIGRRPNC